MKVELWDPTTTAIIITRQNIAFQKNYNVVENSLTYHNSLCYARKSYAELTSCVATDDLSKFSMATNELSNCVFVDVTAIEGLT